MEMVVRLLPVIVFSQLIACAALHAESVEDATRCFSEQSDSMFPTIAKNAFVSVVPYRDISSAQRGDVVVFKLPRNEQSFWIKRLIGLPGDRHPRRRI